MKSDKLPFEKNTVIAELQKKYPGAALEVDEITGRVTDIFYEDDDKPYFGGLEIK